MRKIKNYKYKKIIVLILTTVFIFAIYKYKQNKNNDMFIPVLMYHNLDQSPELKKITYTMKPKRFKKHMEVLKKKGFSPITITELNDYIDNNKELPKKPILITLDDGKANNYEYAYPILDELDMKGNMFIIVHTAENYKNDQYLDWERLKEIYDSGIVDIQSHTYDLHHKINKTPVIFKSDDETEEEYKERISNDFKLSKTLIENNIGNEVVALAYPYGEYNEEIEEIAKKAGYKQTYTTKIGVYNKDEKLYSIKRLNVDGFCSSTRLILEIKLLEIINTLKK